jgi:hypothetical protein
MYRPNGIAVVTTGLGAVVLFHVFWSWGSHSEARPEPNSPPPSVTSDAGAVLQFHSGAWRPRPDRAEAETALNSAPAALPAAVADLSSPATVVSTALPLPTAAAAPSAASSGPVRSVPVQQLRARTQAPALPPDAEASAEKAPSELAEEQPAAGSAPAPPEGRMALAGPDAETAPVPPASHLAHSSLVPRSAPKAHAPAPPAEAPTLMPVENRFGPGNFKEFDRNGY